MGKWLGFGKVRWWSCSHGGLILCLVKVKTLCHPHSDNQQSLYISSDYKNTNERGRELQTGLVKDIKSKDRGITWIYVATELHCSTDSGCHVGRAQFFALSDVIQKTHYLMSDSSDCFRIVLLLIWSDQHTQPHHQQLCKTLHYVLWQRCKIRPCSFSTGHKWSPSKGIVRFQVLRERPSLKKPVFLLNNNANAAYWPITQHKSQGGGSNEDACAVHDFGSGQQGSQLAKYNWVWRKWWLSLICDVLN